MHPIYRAVICGLLVGSPLCSAQAQEQLQELWTAANWHGYLFKTPTGHFDRCTTIVQFNDGTTVGFSINGNAKLRMHLTRENFVIESSQKLQLDLAVDNRPYGFVEGERSTINPRQAVFDLGSNFMLLRDLRKGMTLSLNGELGRWNFSLAGSSVALRRMAECIPRRTSTGYAAIGNAPLQPYANAAMLGFAGDPFGPVIEALTEE